MVCDLCSQFTLTLLSIQEQMSFQVWFSKLLHSLQNILVVVVFCWLWCWRNDHVLGARSWRLYVLRQVLNDVVCWRRWPTISQPQPPDNLHTSVASLTAVASLCYIFTDGRFNLISKGIRCNAVVRDVHGN